jgi:type IV pilus assembly protein PilA
MKKKGFTLIELLVVVAIIGILAAVGVVAYNGYTSSAKVNAVKSNFKIVQKKLGEAVTACSIRFRFLLGRWK